MVLTPELQSEAPVNMGVISVQIAGPHPQISDSTGLGWGP